MRRLAVVLMLLGALAALLGTTAPSAGAAPSPGDESAFVAAVNARRASAGLPALQVDPELTQAARDWAEQMAAAGRISHAPDITAGISSYWLKVGENVGTGPTVNAVMEAFVASPGHNANIMDPAFTHIGVGVVWSGSALYTVHRFMQVQSAPATTAPAPATTAPPATAAPQTTAPPSLPAATTSTTTTPRFPGTVPTTTTPRFPGPTPTSVPLIETTTTSTVPPTTTTLAPVSARPGTDRDRTLRVFQALQGVTP